MLGGTASGVYEGHQHARPYAGDSDLVSQTLPLAETAAAYDLAFISHVDPEPLNDQTGFVVFVSGSASDSNRWFRSGPPPEEQTGDADGSVTHLLEGRQMATPWTCRRILILSGWTEGPRH